MLNDGLNDALLLEVLDALPCQRSVDLHAVDQGGDGDEAERRDILVELLGGGLVENDGVLSLVLDLALGPVYCVSDMCWVLLGERCGHGRILVRHVGFVQ